MGLQSKPTNTVISHEYKNTTTSNPYAYSKTDNSGTISGFQDGTALQSIYKFLNNHVDTLLNEYLNPNLNSATNQARIRSFTNTLSNQTRNNLENNIINPLSGRNMIRSSQASDLYKNLLNQNISAIANYANELISDSQNNSANILKNLFTYYMQGANYLNDLQNHSLKASSGIADKYNYTNSSNSNSEMIQDLLPYMIAAVGAFI